jgi:hypothetical protein
VTLAALSLVESGCAPAAVQEAVRIPYEDPLPFAWKTAARACTVEAPGACAGEADVCAPASAAGFSLCIRASGDVPCPGAAFPVRHTFYDGASDTRGCSPCGCAPPEGGVCTGSVSLYEDGACASAIDQVAVASTGPVCLDVQPPGTPLGSARVSAPSYQPGTCAANGGEPTGALAPEGPTTFCCQASVTMGPRVVPYPGEP